MDEIHYEYIKTIVKKYNIRGKKVLELGSWLPDYQTHLSIRPLFKDSQYVGVDMREGPNVDIVANGHKLPFNTGEFDVVICMNTIEHDDLPFETVKELERVCSACGICILCAPFNFPIHDFPNDYFRYTPEGIRSFGKLWRHQHVYAVGNKYVPLYSMGIFSNFPLVNIEKEFSAAIGKYLKPKFWDIVRRFKWEVVKNCTKVEVKQA